MIARQSTVGFYGLGSMGIGMARNLAKHLSSVGHEPLKYSNRTLEKGDELKAFGAVPVEDFGALVRGCDIIFTMISNDDILRFLIGEALNAGCPLTGKVFVDCSTVHPDTSAQCAELLSGADAKFFASPVFGASSMAAAGRLIFAIAGPEESFHRIEPSIQDVMARSIIRLGPDVRRSSLLKITGNCMVIGMQELISECHVFAEKSGLGTEVFHQFASDMYGETISGYSTRLVTGAYAPQIAPSSPPGFAISHSIKDAKHAVNIAQSCDAHLPTMQTALRNMLSARAYAGDWLDSSALYGVLRQWAGLKFWNANSRQGN